MFIPGIPMSFLHCMLFLSQICQLIFMSCRTITNLFQSCLHLFPLGIQFRLPISQLLEVFFQVL
uniref:Uncharacterized protein MANES_12G032800 n=1 Tax=Rhizophora mucronata TaxID=61149 RepID=A0A2P2LWW4_RHIMU